MCSLCGVLAGRGHWSDASSNPEAFQGRSGTHTWHRERQDRTRLVNRVLKFYGLTLSDWAATSYVLRSGTGRTVLIQDLSELWTAAEDLASRPCDPLEESLIEALAENG